VRKRKVTYPPPKTSTRPAPPPGVAGEAPYIRPQLATIDLTARLGRGNYSPGDRVRILGTGLYAGETAVVTSIAGGVIPAADVRTDAGRTRRVRTIDLEPVAAAPPSAPPPLAEPGADAGATAKDA
jgi:hypothetical protein